MSIANGDMQWRDSPSAVIGESSLPDSVQGRILGDPLAECALDDSMGANEREQVSMTIESPIRMLDDVAGDILASLPLGSKIESSPVHWRGVWNRSFYFGQAPITTRVSDGQFSGQTFGVDGPRVSVRDGADEFSMDVEGVLEPRDIPGLGWDFGLGQITFHPDPRWRERLLSIYGRGSGNTAARFTHCLDPDKILFFSALVVGSLVNETTGQHVTPFNLTANFYGFKSQVELEIESALDVERRTMVENVYTEDRDGMVILE